MRGQYPVKKVSMIFKTYFDMLTEESGLNPSVTGTTITLVYGTVAIAYRMIKTRSTAYPGDGHCNKVALN